MGATDEETADAPDHVNAAVVDLARGVVDNYGPPALPDFARAYLRRPAGSAAEQDGDAESLLAEIRGAYDLATSRDGAPAAVRAFTPTRPDHGYETVGSVLETNTPDLPFLVDSITAELGARGLKVLRVAHPILGVERDPDGRIARVTHPRDAPRESVMHFELDRRLAPEELAALEDAARGVLATVRAVVDDFPAMRETLERLAARVGDDEDAAELAAFLEWLEDDHFLFLGLREGDRELGVLAHHQGAWRAPDDDPPGGPRDGLHITKTTALSPVHRREPLDAILLGGDIRILGMFTSRAYNEPASTTPLLRRKLRHIVEAEDLIEGSHDYKAAVAIFDGFPKDELFAAPADDLRRALASLLALQGDDVRLLGRRDPDGRGASLVAALPRARHSAQLRDRLRDVVADAYGTARVDVHEVLGEADRVQIHLTVRAPGGLPEVDIRDLERRVVLLSRTWADRVADLLVDRLGDERGRMLAARWVRRLPESYRAAVDPVTAGEDIERFEQLTTGAQPFVVGLQEVRAPGGGRHTRVALYKSGPKVELSRATPMLEHLGLRVIEEVASRLHGDDETWVQAFHVLGGDDAPLDLDEAGSRVCEVLAAVWRGEAESDSLNRLVINAGLRWHQVEVLRAYRRYRQRIGSRYTEGFQNDVIAANPGITAKLMRLFELRFDPSQERDEAAERALHDEVIEDLEHVELLDHDRILRNQLGLIEATVRTNVFRRDRDAMAFKLRSADVPAIPQPAPMFEIYVYASDMEGIHLRGGRIARGGLRWSDRMDYRTEVYGLMRAQMTKNAIIVPTGAKGGFLLKRRPDAVAGPESLTGEVRRQYVRYIEALLDVTDNLVDGRVDHPRGVRVIDEDDTYLVVAADKGTATFSDTANEIAQRRGFWLGDAFASGGSAGYDHKALGITARGAWESVRRHFRDLGTDPERDEITVVGIGDMSGDVFGNGMLLSRTLRLIAAYDHRHIFLDPNPADAERSWEERRRLFDLPGSSWDDYDRELISAGGGVFSRAAKRVPISDEARAALQIDDRELAPSDLIRAILRAPADLLWNGGIGTVVKATTQSDADAMDRSSDAIRVDAGELRVRVVGEGGNLGFTQLARIEFARNGRRINADFIDNSAGVDSSDHEVNLKILLDLAVRRGELSADERNALLREVTDDVVEHVLYDSFLQAQILTQEERCSADRMFAYEDLMDELEENGMLDRRSEALPAADGVAELRRTGDGFTRPELAVLVAYAKRALTDALLESDLPEDPAFEVDLRGYFPAAIVDRFGDLLPEHPLRRELIATLVSNDVVNALGPTFVSGLGRELGAAAAHVARAYRVARDVTGASARWDAIEELDPDAVPQDVVWRLMTGVDDLVAAIARWYVVHEHEIDVLAATAAGREAFGRLADAMGQLRSEAWVTEHEAVAAELQERGVPEEIARRHAFQIALIHVPDVLAVSQATGRPLEEAARTCFVLGEHLRLEWLEQQVLALPAGTRTQRWAEQALLDDVLGARRELALRALEEHPEASAEDAVEAFVEARAPLRRRLAGVVRALSSDGTADLAGLTLAVRHLRGLAG